LPVAGCRLSLLGACSLWIEIPEDFFVGGRPAAAGFSGQEIALMIADSPLTTYPHGLHGLYEEREHHLAPARAEATDAEPDDVTIQTAAGLAPSSASCSTAPRRSPSPPTHVGWLRQR
jgi:hypothetical protein